ncbi:MAG TPA: hypothetical protein VFI02_14120 [Armatimonadota bacterium]|nr:hypothetical protein [Armatimonadota bacterium]
MSKYNFIREARLRRFLKHLGYQGQVSGEFVDQLEAIVRKLVGRSLEIPTNRKKLKIVWGRHAVGGDEI